MSGALSHGVAMTDELSKFKQITQERSKMNTIYKMIYDYLRKKVERDEAIFRNARLLERIKANSGYSKAGH